MKEEIHRPESRKCGAGDGSAAQANAPPTKKPHSRAVFKSGIETLLVGGLAAALASVMGHGVRRLYDMF